MGSSTKGANDPDGMRGFDPSRCPRAVNGATAEHLRDVDATAVAVAGRFVSLEAVPRSHGRAVARMLLKDYAERLVTFVVGADRACVFLQCVAEEAAFR